MDNEPKGNENRGTVAETKKQIKDRNKDSEAIHSHAKILENNMLGLVIIYKDGTYDKHIVNFSRQAYMTMVDEKELIIKYKGGLYKLIPQTKED